MNYIYNNVKNCELHSKFNLGYLVAYILCNIFKHFPTSSSRDHNNYVN